MEWREALEKALVEGNTLEVIEQVREWLHVRSPLKSQPVDRVRWVPVEKVRANDYNPNRVSPPEMALLKHSIDADGYTQPVVVVEDGEGDYVVVDGFHRYLTCKSNPDIYERNHGRLPVVVIDVSLADRMASTVRHNRARGRHTVEGMSGLIFDMLEQGYTDAEVCNTLGMEVEELVRLKHITGFSKLFDDVEYSKEWATKSQVRQQRQWRDKLGVPDLPA